MSEVTLTKGAAPGAPPAGKIKFYAKTDGRLYYKDEFGTEVAFKPVGVGSGDLLSDGTVPLTANWDVGPYKLIALQYESDATTGTAPFIVASTTVVANLNADLLDGQEGSYYASVAYVDASVVGLLDHKGGYDASTNTPDLDTSPSGIKKGDAYVVTVAGTFYSTPLGVGDWLYANIDDPASAADWTIVEGNLDAATVKTLYESNADTNAFTDAEQNKLTNIEALADVTDATNVEAAGAVMDGDFTAGEGFMRKTGAGAYEAIKSNLTAITNPGVNNDSSQGYGAGSFWLNTVTGLPWWCADASVGAAVWSSGGGGGMSVTPVKTGNYTAGENEVVPVDSSGGAFTITLPSGPEAQSRNIIIDVGKACSTYAVTIGRNGATIDGAAADFTLDQNHGRWDGSYDGVSDWAAHLTGVPEVINVDVYVSGYSSVNNQTGTSYVPTLDDQNALVTMNNASANTFNIPANATLAYDVGTVLNVMQIGAGQTTVTVTTDTLNGNPKINAQYEQVSVVKIATTTWVVIGGVA